MCLRKRRNCDSLFLYGTIRAILVSATQESGLYWPPGRTNEACFSISVHDGTVMSV